MVVFMKHDVIFYADFASSLMEGMVPQQTIWRSIMFDIMMNFVLWACIGIACGSLACSLSIDFMEEDELEECGVEF
jgi:hypothetical protein